MNRHRERQCALWPALVGAAVGVAFGATARATDEAAALAAGQRIYAQHCASCHGKMGEGVAEEYEDPLVGDKSAMQLAKYVARWMPEDEPKRVVGEEAERVARYVHGTFYSPVAQARRRPPRIELARLTVRQHRQSLADLIGAFGRRAAALPAERGVRGVYFKSQRLDHDKVMERIDAGIGVDLGAAFDGRERFDKQGFAVRWTGALLVPETGRYEIVLRGESAARLWVNDRREPLIDAWVRSGEDTERRATLMLLGRRAYPIKLEVSTHDQGVTDKKQHKRDASEREIVELRWKRPGHVERVIDAAFLAPGGGAETFITTAPFPPDDRSAGYERGVSISRMWDDAATAAAIEAADYIADHLDEFAGKAAGEADATASVAAARKFCVRFVERAFRRPLSEAERLLYIERQFEAAPGAASAVKRVVLLTLKSPRFLYVDFAGPEPSDYDVAARLALTLWDGLPDDALLDAAAKGQLESPEQLRAQARRMLDDGRAQAKLRRFVDQWLHLDGETELTKDAERYEGFDAALASDLRRSLELTIDDVLASPRSDWRELLTSPTLFVNDRMARYYGYEATESDGFVKHDAREPQRIGVLTHPYVMARLAYNDASSPIHRGVFLARHVLGRAIKPPPEAFAPDPVELKPQLTTRQRVAEQTKSRTCQSCHGLINSLGFTLEHFDAVGRFRATERDQPIDAVGAYELPTGETLAIDGSTALVRFLLERESTRRAFAMQLFEYLVKQNAVAYGEQTPQRLSAAFAERDYSVRELMIEIAALAARFK